MAVGVVVVNLAAGIWTFQNLTASRAEYERTAEIASKNVSSALDTSISALADHIDLILQGSADFLEDRLRRDGRLDSAEVERLLRRQQSRLPPLVGLRVSGPDGTVLFGEGVVPDRRVSWSDHPFFPVLRDRREAGTLVTDPLVGAVSHQPIVAFARRYSAPDGSFAGVVAASVTVDHLEAMLSKLDIGPHGTVALRDSHYGLIARIPPVAREDAGLGTRLYSRELQGIFDSGVQTQVFRTTTPTDHVERVFTYRRLRSVPFHLVAGLAKDDYLSDWKQNAFATILYFLSFVGLTTIGSLFVLRALSRAEESAEYKTRFLANMSHEIRTPMNAILGMLRLVRNTPLSPQQQDYLGKMDSAARTLLSLLNDVLDYSKLEAGQMTIERSLFSLDEVLRRLSAVLAGNVQGASVQVLYDIADEVPEWLRGDEVRLQQVLINLGGNALKFTPEGQIVISVRVVQRWATRVRLEFAVADSGIGIDPAHQKRIFAGFAQAEASTTRRFGGTGLGLAISSRLVQLMGGALAVQSQPGRGSTFSFALDYWLEANRPDSAAVPGLVPGRALVIDPNELALELTARTLRMLGWEVVVAATPELALERAYADEGAPFSLVCVDSAVGAAGLAALKSICALATVSGARAPAILELVAQRAGAAHGGLFGALGAPHALVWKPFTRGMVAQAIRQCLATDEASVAAPAPRMRRLAGLRILVVEDNQLNQQVAEELLGSEGAAVCLAANGRLGVEAVRAASPQFDIVLMDVQMPVMDGFNATRAIRGELGCDVPILAMTANAAVSDRQACLEAGMNDHVGKPFDLDRLVSVVLSWVRVDAGAGAGHAAPVAASPGGDGASDAVDIPAALRRLGDSVPLFLKALDRFRQGVGPFFETLARDIDAQDLEGAIRSVHTMKSTAAVVGANRVAGLAAELERAWKSAGAMAAVDRRAVSELEAEVRSAVRRLEAQAAALAQALP